jgi:exopolyphosphatase/guanosine-5'-triphosphate,3'-diphosphate pyrophosphatase
MAEIDPPARASKAVKDKPGQAARRQRPSGESGKNRPPRPTGPQNGPRAHNGTSGAAPAASAPRDHAFHRQSYAAIDLGTNNCRLLIARPQGEHFVVIDAFSRVVRLGEGLAQHGRLSDAAMDRALGALQVCADKLRRRNVTLARSVATEACRRATNGPEFIERVRRETGIALDIITAQEEARLAVLGCHLLLEPGSGPAVIFDIGGGSTELVLVDPGCAGVPEIRAWKSIPWGVVSLTETCGTEPDDMSGRLARYERMRTTVADSLSAFAATLENAADRQPGLRLLGTSGTVTTLASVHLGLPQYDRSAVDGLVMDTTAMQAVTDRIASMSLRERWGLACIGKERSDLVVAGCAILDTIFSIWPAPRLGIADRGIREGILRGLIAAGEAGERGRASVRGRPS